MYSTLLADTRFHELLLAFDADLADTTRAGGCALCHGVLHSARYPRKPRGRVALVRPVREPLSQRVQIAENNDEATLKQFADAHVAPAAAVTTDGLASYNSKSLGERPHEGIVQTKAERRVHDTLQGVHWTMSLLKRWLLGTCADAVSAKHLLLTPFEVFHAVMVGGSAGRAAELLSTSQPTISRTLARLEATLSLKLFNRILGRLLPTREGQLFFAEVRANLVGLDQLRQSAARIREVGDGIIRIASLAAMGHGLVPRAIARFTTGHPNVTVSYQVRTSGVVRDLIASGRFDIGLAADKIDSSGVDATVFATPRAVCAVPAGHRLTGRKHITAKHLAGEPLIVLSPQDSVRRAMARAFAGAGVTPKIVVETPYSLTVAALVGRGTGIGLVNSYALEGMDRSAIVVRQFEPAIHFRALLLRTPGAPSSALVEEFLKLLYEERQRTTKP